MNLNPKNLLLIFTRNPELGKVKTRLAKDVGDQTALDIYKFLLDHTVSITENLPITKEVYYSEKIHENDIWDPSIYKKKQQVGAGLGERMEHAFATGFKNGFSNIIIIGSDMYDITAEELMEAFKKLDSTDFAIGPAEDGGYYLLGMRKLKPAIFANKEWGTNTVLKDTLQDLNNESTVLLEVKNDVDYFSDIKEHIAFQQFF
ncbi:TIGR04282 family arsenosugar biosynthesis glycosyltransferase [Gillisia sp. CAL575]|uniref:TIGR04282 family arsenosugar biosynthesis glycosyltransferase n=1 Tax=Gillisia sp. CAL575 TaxID=985255 RepID=UPI0003A1914E|nr:TIGR04282 family arsenosugar biosynthesis glycosyltransferase [Gillisia sp. CAL575]